MNNEQIKRYMNIEENYHKRLDDAGVKQAMLQKTYNEFYQNPLIVQYEALKESLVVLEKEKEEIVKFYNHHARQFLTEDCTHPIVVLTGKNETFDPLEGSRTEYSYHCLECFQDDSSKPFWHNLKENELIYGHDIAKPQAKLFFDISSFDMNTKEVLFKQMRQDYFTFHKRYYMNEDCEDKAIFLMKCKYGTEPKDCYTESLSIKDLYQALLKTYPESDVIATFESHYKKKEKTIR